MSFLTKTALSYLHWRILSKTLMSYQVDHISDPPGFFRTTRRLKSQKNYQMTFFQFLESDKSDQENRIL